MEYMDISGPETDTGHNQNAAESATAEKLPAAKEAFHDILFGSIAGVVGKVIEFPFDTVKVRLQSQPDHVPLQYNGPIDCLKQSLRQDGFPGIYRGVSAPLLGAAVETSSLFFSVSSTDPRCPR
jgi:ornithine carrier protein